MKVPPITQKQQDILMLLYTYRFLSTRHIQTMLDHKEPRRIKAWLKDLTDKGFITMDYERNSIDDNRKPAVFSLAPKARHILKQNKICTLKMLNKIYKEKRRTKKFIQECLTIADLYLFFLSQKKVDETLHFYTQSLLDSYDYFPDPLPTAYMTVKTKTKTRRYFIDLFNDYTPPFVARKRFKKYLQYERDGDWQARGNESLPTILFICPNTTFKNHILHYTKGVFAKEFEESIKLFVTTREKIRMFVTKNLWEKATVAID